MDWKVSIFDDTGLNETGSVQLVDETVRLEREKENTPLEQIENYINTKVKDDPNLVAQLVRVGLSAYTDNPINIFLLAPSADGKTYATVKTMENFPKGDVILIGRITPTALIYQHGKLIDADGNSIQERLNDMDEKIANCEEKKEKQELVMQRKILTSGARNCVDLKNKILVFLDNPNPATFEMLKPIMSHDTREIIYKSTKSDGSLQAVETVIRNWPVFIFCSAKNEAKNEVWEEVKTRVMMTSPNSNVKKHKAANRYTAQKMGLPNWASSIYHNSEDEKWAKWHILEFKKMLNELCDDGNPVTNTFRKQIAELFPSSQGEFMRHFPRLFSFINLETMLNSDRRPIYEIETEKGALQTIISTIDDVDKACGILGNISSLPPEKIKFYDEVFCPMFARKLDAAKSTLDCPWLNSTELAKEYTDKLHKTITSKQILENYLNPLTDAGVLIKDDDFGKQNQYKKDGTLTVHTLKDLKFNIIEQSNIIWLGVISCLEDLSRCSIEMGKTNEKLTLNKIQIDLGDLIEHILGKKEQICA